MNKSEQEWSVAVYDDGYTVDVREGNKGASLFPAGHLTEQQAHLIAAAPSMYEALREIIAACEAVTIGTDAVAEPLAIALSAIAKAEGRQ